MRKMPSLVLSVLALSGAAVMAGPAGAGEVSGPSGNPTPVKSGVAASACAFSGDNDFGEGQTLIHVQSYGADVSGRSGEEPFGQPGTGEINCRGTR